MALTLTLVNNTTTYVGAGDPEIDLSNTNDVLVTSTGMVMSTTGVGISSTGAGGVAQHADIEGTVIGATIAIDMGSAAQHDQSLYVGQNGYVANLGGTEAAVVMRGYNDIVTNHGVIHGVSAGLEMQALSIGTPHHSTVDNFNLIEGAIGMRRDSGYDQEIILHNHGEVRGTANGIIGYVSYNGDGATNAIDTIENSGLMFGSVLLGAGNDSYDGTGGRVEKGAVFGGDGADKLTGGDFADILSGDAGSDALIGGDGDDTLTGGAGQDQVLAGGGFDNIDGGADQDQVQGGTGNDTIHGGDEMDQLWGDDGIDQVYGDAGDDHLFGGDGNDFLYGGTGADSLDGDAGDDTLDGGSEADTLRGGDGNDHMDGGGGVDFMVGAAGDDQLDGGTGADIMIGGMGNDTFIVDDAGDKVFDFGGGVDLVRSSVTFNLADPNQVQGTFENLELTGANNIDATGNAFANRITGNAGNNRIDGKAGADTLIGLAGNDRIDGGFGKDTMTGGLGNDKFVFDTQLNAKTNVDLVTDFKHGADTVLLDNAIFNALGLQQNVALKAGFFHAGSAAADADDHIIYNSANGALSYDADGVGGQAAIQFATLSGHPTIDFHDFVVI